MHFSKQHVFTVATSASIGLLGGLIGLGGAEFRLPLLIGMFGFASMDAVILNKTMSLIVVASALPFRAGTIPFTELLAHWDVIVNLMAGGVAGAWFGAGWTLRLDATILNRTIACLLALMAGLLLVGHDAVPTQSPVLSGLVLISAGVAAGFAIGVVASLMGVAGGELLIPTLVLLFGIDIKLAGSLSLAISLPTMLSGITRYRNDPSFAVVARHRNFVLLMAMGSLAGSFGGSRLVGVIPPDVLLPILAAILLISAFKIWRHDRG